MSSIERRAIDSPWLHRDGWPEGVVHDASTCDLCNAASGPAWERGVAAARAEAAALPAR